MPEQILLQGKILGTEEFLLAGPAEGRSVRSAGEDLLAGKSQWITLLCDVLPRALLAELGLARILLGSSGGGQFLVVLPGNVREAAETFLTAAAAQISDLSAKRVKLVWAVTDNLGDWAVIRKRLNEELQSKGNAPLRHIGAAAFQPFIALPGNDSDQYFARELGRRDETLNHFTADGCQHRDLCRGRSSGQAARILDSENFHPLLGCIQIGQIGRAHV